MRNQTQFSIFSITLRFSTVMILAVVAGVQVVDAVLSQGCPPYPLEIFSSVGLAFFFPALIYAFLTKNKYMRILFYLLFSSYGVLFTFSQIYYRFILEKLPGSFHEAYLCYSQYFEEAARKDNGGGIEILFVCLLSFVFIPVIESVILLRKRHHLNLGEPV